MGTGWIRYLSEMNGFACILISVQFDTKCRILVNKELRFGASCLRASCNSEPAAQEHAEAGHTMRICVTVPIKPIEPIQMMQNAETVPIKPKKPILAGSWAYGPGTLRPELKSVPGLVFLVFLVQFQHFATFG